jgi:FixJ family two-component response regulator
VVDVHMPEMSGLELLDAMRSDGTIKPAVLITGALDHAIQRAAARGGVILLEKPFTAEHLVDAILEARRRQH